VTLVEHADGTISLTNGLLTRTFALAPGFGTVAYVAEATAARPREHVLRSVVAEATVVLDGVAYAVGGLSLDQNHSAYLRRPDTYAVDDEAFAYVSHSTSSPEAPVPWEHGRRHAPNASWPPEGLRLDVAFRAPAGATRHRNVTVWLHYELYAGAPLLAKWASLAVDAGAADVVVDRVDVELLAVNAPFAKEDVARHTGRRPGPRGGSTRRRTSRTALRSSGRTTPSSPRRRTRAPSSPCSTRPTRRAPASASAPSTRSRASASSR
jgi:hypothetical protein